MNILREIKVSKHIVTNILMWELVNDDKYKDADLIVIGSHGKSGFQKAFIGSNTEKIVRMADIPVLTIKNSIRILILNRWYLHQIFMMSHIQFLRKFIFLLISIKFELIC